MRKKFPTSAVLLTLAVGVASVAGQLGGVVDTAKQAGEATKEAAKTAGEETKKGATTTKDVVTGKAHATCVDGTQQTAKTPKAAAAACAKHGGVAKK
jgi:hypothetical protein